MEGSSAAQNLLSNVGQLLAAEYQQLSSVGGEVAELRDDLAAMNALLLMQSEAKDGVVDPFIKEIMKQVRELAYDAEDRVDLYRLRIKCRPGDGVFARFKHLFATLFPRRRLAGDIRALRARAIAISERHARYGVNRDALRRSPAFSPAPMLTASAPAQALRLANGPEHHQLFGIKCQAATLVERLKKRVDGEQHLKVFSIVGFGGVGKTTLAMEVCRMLEMDFPHQAMVSVSQAFDPGRDLKALHKRMLLQVIRVKTENERGIREEANQGQFDQLDVTFLNQIDNWSSEKLVQELQNYLMDKRYLIMVDDVWTVRAWEAIQSVLPQNNLHSRIIVTTRIETVAKACSPAVGGHAVHQMKPLEFEDSKSLFLSRTFGLKNCPPELEDVMNNILKRCGGIPLAIVSIASVLTSYTSPGSKYKWESIYKSIGYHMESNPTLEGMRQIVTLSFNHLPHELKGCMMYLSIFPEDYEIRKDRLLCRWIAEGLILEKRGLTLMEVAESYFDELVSRNMIGSRTEYSYYWRKEFCRVHDMLLEVMVSKSLEFNFVSLLGGQYAGMSYDRIRRLSIQGDDDRISQNIGQHKKKMAGKGIDGMDMDHIRSLSVFQQGWQKLLDQLDKFTLLRVLDLEGCEGLTTEHMRYICRLYLLKFLSLKGTDIKEVPPQIKKLEHLQTLDVRHTQVPGLPETVTELYKLERLQISHHNIKTHLMWRLPPGLGKMKALREVGFAFLGNDVQVARDLGELEQLQEISIYADTDNINDMEVLRELSKSLSKSYSLKRLIIGDVGFGKALNILHEITKPPQLLRYLMIAGAIDGLPTWVGSLTHLVQFNMSWGLLVGDQLYDVLCQLPSLRTIGVQQQCYVDRELVARAKHRFPELTDLYVASNYETPNVIRFEEGTMAKLETLLFNFTDKEKSIVGIEHLKSLKEVHLWGDKNNSTLCRALEVLKDENKRRSMLVENQFRIVVRYQ
ncbi:hypothetical protein EJB05_15312, partial [Eragrostis curvula]